MSCSSINARTGGSFCCETGGVFLCIMVKMRQPYFHFNQISTVWEVVSRDVEAGLGQKEVKERILFSTLETAGGLQGPHHGVVVSLISLQREKKPVPISLSDELCTWLEGNRTWMLPLSKKCCCRGSVPVVCEEREMDWKRTGKHSGGGK